LHDIGDNQRDFLVVQIACRGEVDRATTYDEQLAAERRDAHREEAWQLARRLFERAEELLSFLIAEVTIETSRQVSEDGKRVAIINQVIKPARWTQRDILSYVATYDKLGRLAAGMDSEQQRLAIDGLMPQDLDNLSDEELDRLEKELAKKRAEVTYCTLQKLRSCGSEARPKAND
jgi:hypothetical protein